MPLTHSNSQPVGSLISQSDAQRSRQGIAAGGYIDSVTSRDLGVTYYGYTGYASGHQRFLQDSRGALDLVTIYDGGPSFARDEYFAGIRQGTRVIADPRLREDTQTVQELTRRGANITYTTSQQHAKIQSGIDTFVSTSNLSSRVGVSGDIVSRPRNETNTQYRRTLLENLPVVGGLFHRLTLGPQRENTARRERGLQLETGVRVSNPQLQQEIRQAIDGASRGVYRQSPNIVVGGPGANSTEHIIGLLNRQGDSPIYMTMPYIDDTQMTEYLSMESRRGRQIHIVTQNQSAQHSSFRGNDHRDRVQNLATMQAAGINLYAPDDDLLMLLHAKEISSGNLAIVGSHNLTNKIDRAGENRYRDTANDPITDGSIELSLVLEDGSIAGAIENNIKQLLDNGYITRFNTVGTLGSTLNYEANLTLLEERYGPEALLNTDPSVFNRGQLFATRNRLLETYNRLTTGNYHGPDYIGRRDYSRASSRLFESLYQSKRVGLGLDLLDDESIPSIIRELDMRRIAESDLELLQRRVYNENPVVNGLLAAGVATAVGVSTAYLATGAAMAAQHFLPRNHNFTSYMPARMAGALTGVIAGLYAFSQVYNNDIQSILSFGYAQSDPRHDSKKLLMSDSAGGITRGLVDGIADRLQSNLNAAFGANPRQEYDRFGVLRPEEYTRPTALKDLINSSYGVLESMFIGIGIYYGAMTGVREGSAMAFSMLRRSIEFSSQQAAAGRASLPGQGIAKLGILTTRVLRQQEAASFTLGLISPMFGEQMGLTVDVLRPGMTSGHPTTVLRRMSFPDFEEFYRGLGRGVYDPSDRTSINSRFYLERLPDGTLNHVGFQFGGAKGQLRISVDADKIMSGRGFQGFMGISAEEKLASAQKFANTLSDLINLAGFYGESGQVLTFYTKGSITADASGAMRERTKQAKIQQALSQINVNPLSWIGIRMGTGKGASIAEAFGADGVISQAVNWATGVGQMRFLPTSRTSSYTGIGDELSYFRNVITGNTQEAARQLRRIQASKAVMLNRNRAFYAGASSAQLGVGVMDDGVTPNVMADDLDFRLRIQTARNTALGIAGVRPMRLLAAGAIYGLLSGYMFNDQTAGYSAVSATRMAMARSALEFPVEAATPVIRIGVLGSSARTTDPETGEQTETRFDPWFNRAAYGVGIIGSMAGAMYFNPALLRGTSLARPGAAIQNISALAGIGMKGALLSALALSAISLADYGVAGLIDIKRRNDYIQSGMPYQQGNYVNPTRSAELRRLWETYNKVFTRSDGKVLAPYYTYDSMRRVGLDSQADQPSQGTIRRSAAYQIGSLYGTQFFSTDIRGGAVRFTVGAQYPLFTSGFGIDLPIGLAVVRQPEYVQRALQEREDGGQGNNSIFNTMLFNFRPTYNPNTRMEAILRSQASLGVVVGTTRAASMVLNEAGVQIALGFQRMANSIVTNNTGAFGTAIASGMNFVGDLLGSSMVAASDSMTNNLLFNSLNFVYETQRMGLRGATGTLSYLFNTAVNLTGMAGQVAQQAAGDQISRAFRSLGQAPTPGSPRSNPFLLVGNGAQMQPNINQANMMTRHLSKGLLNIGASAYLGEIIGQNVFGLEGIGGVLGGAIGTYATASNMVLARQTFNAMAPMAQRGITASTELYRSISRNLRVSSPMVGFNLQGRNINLIPHASARSIGRAGMYVFGAAILTSLIANSGAFRNNVDGVAPYGQFRNTINLPGADPDRRVQLPFIFAPTKIEVGGLFRRAGNINDSLYMSLYQGNRTQHRNIFGDRILDLRDPASLGRSTNYSSPEQVFNTLFGGFKALFGDSSYVGVPVSDTEGFHAGFFGTGVEAFNGLQMQTNQYLQLQRTFSDVSIAESVVMTNMRPDRLENVLGPTALALLDNDNLPDGVVDSEAMQAVRAYQIFRGYTISARSPRTFSRYIHRDTYRHISGSRAISAGIARRQDMLRWLSNANDLDVETFNMRTQARFQGNPLSGMPTLPTLFTGQILSSNRTTGSNFSSDLELNPQGPSGIQAGGIFNSQGFQAGRDMLMGPLGIGATAAGTVAASLIALSGSRMLGRGIASSTGVRIFGSHMVNTELMNRTAGHLREVGVRLADLGRLQVDVGDVAETIGRFSIEVPGKTPFNYLFTQDITDRITESILRPGQVPSTALRPEQVKNAAGEYLTQVRGLMSNKKDALVNLIGDLNPTTNGLLNDIAAAGGVNTSNLKNILDRVNAFNTNTFGFSATPGATPLQLLTGNARTHDSLNKAITSLSNITGVNTDDLIRELDGTFGVRSASALQTSTSRLQAALNNLQASPGNRRALLTANQRLNKFIKDLDTYTNELLDLGSTGPRSLADSVVRTSGLGQPLEELAQGVNVSPTSRVGSITHAKNALSQARQATARSATVGRLRVGASNIKAGATIGRGLNLLQGLAVGSSVFDLFNPSIDPYLAADAGLNRAGAAGLNIAIGAAFSTTMSLATKGVSAVYAYGVAKAATPLLAALGGTVAKGSLAAGAIATGIGVVTVGLVALGIMAALAVVGKVTGNDAISPLDAIFKSINQGRLAHETAESNKRQAFMSAARSSLTESIMNSGNKFANFIGNAIQATYNFNPSEQTPIPIDYSLREFRGDLLEGLVDMSNAWNDAYNRGAPIQTALSDSIFIPGSNFVENQRVSITRKLQELNNDPGVMAAITRFTLEGLFNVSTIMVPTDPLANINHETLRQQFSYRSTPFMITPFNGRIANMMVARAMAAEQEYKLFNAGTIELVHSSVYGAVNRSPYSMEGARNNRLLDGQQRIASRFLPRNNISQAVANQLEIRENKLMNAIGSLHYGARIVNFGGTPEDAGFFNFQTRPYIQNTRFDRHAFVRTQQAAVRGLLERGSRGTSSSSPSGNTQSVYTLPSGNVNAAGITTQSGSQGVLTIPVSGRASFNSSNQLSYSVDDLHASFMTSVMEAGRSTERRQSMIDVAVSIENRLLNLTQRTESWNHSDLSIAGIVSGRRQYQPHFDGKGENNPNYFRGRSSDDVIGELSRRGYGSVDQLRQEFANFQSDLLTPGSDSRMSAIRALEGRTEFKGDAGLRVPPGEQKYLYQRITGENTFHYPERRPGETDQQLDARVVSMKNRIGNITGNYTRDYLASTGLTRTQGTTRNSPTARAGSSVGRHTSVSGRGFGSGLYTGPRGHIGSGTEFHMDTRVPHSMSMDQRVSLMDGIALEAAARDRVIEFSNPAVSGVRYNPNASHQEKANVLRRAFDAHSHSRSDQAALDYYFVRPGPATRHQPASGAGQPQELIIPFVPGGRVEFGSGGGAGAYYRLYDAQGNYLLTAMHGDSRTPLPAGFTFPQTIEELTPELQALVGGDEEEIRPMLAPTTRGNGSTSLRRPSPPSGRTTRGGTSGGGSSSPRQPSGEGGTGGSRTNRRNQRVVYPDSARANLPSHLQHVPTDVLLGEQKKGYQSIEFILSLLAAGALAAGAAYLSYKGSKALLTNANKLRKGIGNKVRNRFGLSQSNTTTTQPGTTAVLLPHEPGSHGVLLPSNQALTVISNQSNELVPISPPGIDQQSTTPQPGSQLVPLNQQVGLNTPELPASQMTLDVPYEVLETIHNVSSQSVGAQPLLPASDPTQIPEITTTSTSIQTLGQSPQLSQGTNNNSSNTTGTRRFSPRDFINSLSISIDPDVNASNIQHYGVFDLDYNDNPILDDSRQYSVYGNQPNALYRRYTSGPKAGTAGIELIREVHDRLISGQATDIDLEAITHEIGHHHYKQKGLVNTVKARPLFLVELGTYFQKNGMRIRDSALPYKNRLEELKRSGASRQEIETARRNYRNSLHEEAYAYKFGQDNLATAREMYKAYDFTSITRSTSTSPIPQTQPGSNQPSPRTPTSGTTSQPIPSQPTKPKSQTIWGQATQSDLIDPITGDTYQVGVHSPIDGLTGLSSHIHNVPTSTPGYSAPTLDTLHNQLAQVSNTLQQPQHQTQTPGTQLVPLNQQSGLSQLAQPASQMTLDVPYQVIETVQDVSSQTLNTQPLLSQPNHIAGLLPAPTSSSPNVGYAAPTIDTLHNQLAQVSNTLQHHPQHNYSQHQPQAVGSQLAPLNQQGGLPQPPPTPVSQMTLDVPYVVLETTQVPPTAQHNQTIHQLNSGASPVISPGSNTSTSTDLVLVGNNVTPVNSDYTGTISDGTAAQPNVSNPVSAPINHTYDPHFRRYRRRRYSLPQNRFFTPLSFIRAASSAIDGDVNASNITQYGVFDTDADGNKTSDPNVNYGVVDHSVGGSYRRRSSGGKGRIEVHRRVHERLTTGQATDLDLEIVTHEIGHHHYRERGLASRASSTPLFIMEVKTFFNKNKQRIRGSTRPARERLNELKRSGGTREEIKQARQQYRNSLHEEAFAYEFGQKNLAATKDLYGQSQFNTNGVIVPAAPTPDNPASQLIIDVDTQLSTSPSNLPEQIPQPVTIAGLLPPGRPGEYIGELTDGIASIPTLGNQEGFIDPLTQDVYPLGASSNVQFDFPSSGPTSSLDSPERAPVRGAQARAARHQQVIGNRHGLLEKRYPRRSKRNGESVSHPSVQTSINEGIEIRDAISQQITPEIKQQVRERVALARRQRKNTRLDSEGLTVSERAMQEAVELSPLGTIQEIAEVMDIDLNVHESGLLKSELPQPLTQIITASGDKQLKPGSSVMIGHGFGQGFKVNPDDLDYGMFTNTITNDGTKATERLMVVHNTQDIINVIDAPCGTFAYACTAVDRVTDIDASNPGAVRDSFIDPDYGEVRRINAPLVQANPTFELPAQRKDRYERSYQDPHAPVPRYVMVDTANADQTLLMVRSRSGSEPELYSRNDFSYRGQRHTARQQVSNAGIAKFSLDNNWNNWTETMPNRFGNNPTSGYTSLSNTYNTAARNNPQAYERTSPKGMRLETASDGLPQVGMTNGDARQAISEMQDLAKQLGIEVHIGNDRAKTRLGQARATSRASDIRGMYEAGAVYLDDGMDIQQQARILSHELMHATQDIQGKTQGNLDAPRRGGQTRRGMLELRAEGAQSNVGMTINRMRRLSAKGQVRQAGGGSASPLYKANSLAHTLSNRDQRLFQELEDLFDQDVLSDTDADLETLRMFEESRSNAKRPIDVSTYRELGRGGGGIVYETPQGTALKVIYGNDAEAEISAIKTLSESGATPKYYGSHTVTQNGTTYHAVEMEKLQGTTLDKLLDSMDTAAKHSIYNQIEIANTILLDRYGLVHADLSNPENIMLVDGQVKLLDLGVLIPASTRSDLQRSMEGAKLYLDLYNVDDLDFDDLELYSRSGTSYRSQRAQQRRRTQSRDRRANSRLLETQRLGAQSRQTQAQGGMTTRDSNTSIPAERPILWEGADADIQRFRAQQVQKLMREPYTAHTQGEAAAKAQNAQQNANTRTNTPAAAGRRVPTASRNTTRSHVSGVDQPSSTPVTSTANVEITNTTILPKQQPTTILPGQNVVGYTFGDSTLPAFDPTGINPIIFDITDSPVGGGPVSTPEVRDYRTSPVSTGVAPTAGLTNLVFGTYDGGNALEVATSLHGALTSLGMSDTASAVTSVGAASIYGLAASEAFDDAASSTMRRLGSTQTLSSTTRGAGNLLSEFGWAFELAPAVAKDLGSRLGNDYRSTTRLEIEQAYGQAYGSIAGGWAAGALAVGLGLTNPIGLAITGIGGSILGGGVGGNMFTAMKLDDLTQQKMEQHIINNDPTLLDTSIQQQQQAGHRDVPIMGGLDTARSDIQVAAYAQRTEFREDLTSVLSDARHGLGVVTVEEQMRRYEDAYARGDASTAQLARANINAIMQEFDYSGEIDLPLPGHNVGATRNRPAQRSLSLDNQLGTIKSGLLLEFALNDGHDPIGQTMTNAQEYTNNINAIALDLASSASGEVTVRSQLIQHIIQSSPAIANNANHVQDTHDRNEANASLSGGFINEAQWVPDLQQSDGNPEYGTSQENDAKPATGNRTEPQTVIDEERQTPREVATPRSRVDTSYTPEQQATISATRRVVVETATTNIQNTSDAVVNSDAVQRNIARTNSVVTNVQRMFRFDSNRDNGVNSDPATTQSQATDKVKTDAVN